MITKTVTLPNVADLDVEDAKQELRKVARKNRSKRSLQAREDFARTWVDTALDFLGDAQVVAAYVSIKEVPPTLALCDAIVASGKRLLLPKLGPGLTRAWGWYTGAHDLDVLAPGRPPEPSGEALGSEVLSQVDALLVPALLIGRGGTRLGQGGGWYDRILKQIRDDARVGAMVYPDEVVDMELPQDEMDMRIPFVVLPEYWTSTE